MLRHPVDGLAWKHVDTLYLDFTVDPKSVKRGLASDGFNHFSNMTSTYSM